MEEENEKKKKNFMIVLGIVTIFIYVGIFFLVDKKDAQEKRKNAKPVTNYSEFYTVASCASRYINVLADKKANVLLNILSADYKKKNYLTEANVVDALPIIAAGTEFSANGMYYESEKDVYKYYIKGYLETGGLDMNERNRVKTYLIVYLDKKNNLFSVEPYDGKEYSDGVFK